MHYPNLELSFLKYPKICLCIDGSDISTAMVHIVLNEATKANLDISLLFIDEEAIYQETVRQVEYLMALAPKTAEKLWIQSAILLAIDKNKKSFICWQKEMEQHYMRRRTNYSEPAKDIKQIISRLKAERPNTAFLFAKQGNACKRGFGTRPLEYCPLRNWKITNVWQYILLNRLRYHNYYNLALRKQILLEKIQIPSLIRDYPYFAIQELKAFEPDNYRKLVRRCLWCGFEQNTKDVCEKLPERFSDWKAYLYYLLANHPNRNRALLYLRQPVESDKDAYYRTRRLVKYDYGGNLLKPRLRPEIEKARKLMERL